MLSPVQKVKDIWLKRDDLWKGDAPAMGGKARTAAAICTLAIQRGVRELCSAHDRNSSVPGMLSRVCRHYGIGLRLYLPYSKDPLPPVFQEAKDNGAILEEVSPGYMSVRQKRMRDYVSMSSTQAIALGVGLQWLPNRCGHMETIEQTENVRELYKKGEISRVVVPVGSGVMLYSIACGLRNVPILGVCCGNIPSTTMGNVELVQSTVRFGKDVTAGIGEVSLDPTYEAKCLFYLKKGDLLWIVANRETE